MWLKKLMPSNDNALMRDIIQISEKKVNWILFVVFALVIFVECCLAHYFSQHSILISSIWKQPLYFWAFYLPKIAIAAMLGSLVFLLKNKWWLILVSLLINVWIWANMLYFRVYGGFIDGYVMMMADNLKGFESSIAALIEVKDFVFFFMTLLLAILIYLLRKWSKREMKTGLIVFAISCVLWACASNLNFHKYELFTGHSNIRKIAPISVFYNPLSYNTRTIIAGTAPVYDYSILHMFLFAIDDIVEHTLLSLNKPDITKEDLFLIQSRQGSQRYIKKNSDKLILILFESLEDWVVQPEFMPNTYELIRTNHSLHAHKLSKQTLAGGSADGQMLVNTGLLPINRGAVCFEYPFNSFPNLPKKHSATLLPHPIDVWNQKCMSPAYGYDTTIVVKKESEAFNNSVEVLKSGYDMLQIITIASHEPFNAAAESNLSLPSDMPEMMAAYIKCVNVTDSYIGIMIDALKQSQLFDSTTIVITGDHTIFHKERRDVFYSYCQLHGLKYGVENAYCPLIVYSTAYEGRLQCDVEAYQMDVYPTILRVLGYDDYYWKGFGVNLADSAEYNHRAINEKDAYRLSNLMIRNDYFKDSIH